MEREKHERDHHQQEPPPLPQQETHPGQPMFEGPPPMGAKSGGEGGVGAAPGFVTVMTDKQMEILQKQIAAYATICEQLEILHRSLTSSSHNDPAAEFTLRSSITNPYCPPLMMNSNYSFPRHSHNQYYYFGQPKLSRRQRWNPKSEQLQILERIFDQGNEAPSRERIKDITAELAKHGQIAETNVYNWFQNRRARFKKKKQMVMMSTISESSEEREMASETSSKSNNGEKSKSSSGQPIVNGGPTFSKVVSACTDEDSVQRHHHQQPMFSMESSLKTGADGDGRGHGGGAGGIF